MLLCERTKIVEAIAPVDTTGGAQAGNTISLKGYNHCTIIINTGSWAGGDAAVTLDQCTDVSDSDSKTLAFTRYWTNDGAAATDTLTETTCASTFNVDTANSMYIIEIDAADLDTDNNFDCLHIDTASPGANADLISATYILSQPRYADANMPPSALLD